MYMDELFSVKKSDDGKFLFCFRDKSKKEKAEKNEAMEYEEPKTFIANNREELIALMDDNIFSKKNDKEKYKKGWDKG